MLDDARFEREDFGSNAILAVLGEVNMTNSSAFKSGLLQAGVSGNLVVDLSRCTYFDSTGLAALIATYKALGHKRLAVIVRDGSFLRRLFHIAGIESLFVFYDDLDALPLLDGTVPLSGRDSSVRSVR
jgi:anti-anti-sigma factor